MADDTNGGGAGADQTDQAAQLAQAQADLAQAKADIATLTEARDGLAAQLAKAQNDLATAVQDRDEMEDDLEDAQLEIAQYKAAAAAVAAAHGETALPRGVAVKGRKCGPVEPQDAQDVLDHVAAASAVQLVFSDGTAEIGALAPLVLSPERLRRGVFGIVADLSGVTIDGPGPGKLEIAGYGLFVDGDEIAWAQKLDPASLVPGQRIGLAGDVVFAVK